MENVNSNGGGVKAAPPKKRSDVEENRQKNRRVEFLVQPKQK